MSTTSSWLTNYGTGEVSVVDSDEILCERRLWLASQTSRGNDEVKALCR